MLDNGETREVGPDRQGQRCLLSSDCTDIIGLVSFAMGQILIRNVDDAVLASLKQRAERHKTSTEEEARQALAASVGPRQDAVLAKLDAIRALNGPQRGPTSLDLLRADRSRDDDA